MKYWPKPLESTIDSKENKTAQGPKNSMPRHKTQRHHDELSNSMIGSFRLVFWCKTVFGNSIGQNLMTSWALSLSPSDLDATTRNYQMAWQTVVARWECLKVFFNLETFFAHLEAPKHKSDANETNWDVLLVLWSENAYGYFPFYKAS